MGKKKKNSYVADQLREAINACGFTRYRIAQETGVSQTALALFVNGHRGLSMKALDAVGEFLQLKITVGRKAENIEE